MSDQVPYGSGSYAPPNSSMAIVSLIAGILGLTIFPLIGSIVALITGSMAKKEINESRGALGGEGMAKAGVILGWIGVGLSVVGCCIFGAVFALPFILVALGLSQNTGMLLPSILAVL
jgi:hypothetical protein